MQSGIAARPIAPRELAAYSLFALPLLMTALPINLLLPEHYHATTGLSLTVIGLALLACRLVDAVADPLFGAWIDRQKPRGSYMVPIVLALPLLAIGLPLLLIVPSRLGDVLTTAWLLVTLVTTYLGYSLAIVAYQAWGSELAHDDAGRARVTGAREAVGLVGVLVGAVLPSLLGMAALAVLFVPLLGCAAWVLARGTPRPPPAAAAATTGSPYAEFLVPLGTARLRWLLAVFALNAIAPSITATVFPFFVADRLGLATWAPAFLVLYFMAGACSMPLWVRLARRHSLHGVWLCGMVAAVVAFVWAWGLGPGALWPFAAICVLSGLAFGADLALPPALLARVIDANGHAGCREGAYFGLWNFVNKLTLAVAGGIALPLLEAIGYVRGSQADEALAALAFTYALLPCALKLVAAALLYVAWRRERF